MGNVVHELSFIERIVLRFIKFANTVELIIVEFTLVQVTIIKLKLARSLFLPFNKLPGVNHCVLFSSLDTLTMIQIVLPLALVKRAKLAQVHALPVGLAVFEFALVHVAVLH